MTDFSDVIHQALQPDLTPEDFLNNDYNWFLIDTAWMSVRNMSDVSLRESIVDDALTVTMYELENKTSLAWDNKHLQSKLCADAYQRVMGQLSHQEIAGLLVTDGNKIRIRNNREILQAAMDYCGHWYEGYNVPDGVIKCEPVDVTPELADKLAEVFMEATANVASHSTVQ